MNNSLETNRAWLRFWMVILVFLGVLNIFLPFFIVPKFEQIFQDALPGRALPGLTVFIITARIPLACLAVVWPGVGIVAVLMRKRLAMWIVNLGVLFFLLVIPVTIFALFIPMVAADGGMSDASLKAP